MGRKSFNQTRPGEIMVRTAPDFLQHTFKRLSTAIQPAIDAGYDVSRIYLMLDEVLSNIHKHGYKRASDEPIGVQLSIRGERCIITARDLAPTFDSARIARTRVLPDPESGAPGGRGLVIVYRMCESFEHYVPREGGNMVRLVMKLAARRDLADDKTSSTDAETPRAKKTAKSRK